MGKAPWKLEAELVHQQVLGDPVEVAGIDVFEFTAGWHTRPT
jgi:hypothetical protein